MIRRTRSWLYVPASDPLLLTKAMSGSADAVVYDLEDGVASTAKQSARDNVVATISQHQRKPLWVRINTPTSPDGEVDVRVLSGGPIAGVRLPKAEDPDVVAAAAQRLGTPVHLLIESALGVQRAYELACCHPNIAALSLGEADLKADLRIRDNAALDWARQQVVTAARAAMLPSPVHSVWTDVRDVEGLAADTRRARDHGLFGRSVIHPAQVEVVNTVFTPTQDDVSSALNLVNSLQDRGNEPSGGWLDEYGRFVDEAVVAQARWVLELAESLPDNPEREESSP